MKRALVLAVACALSPVASGKDDVKKRKVKWKDVVVVDKVPGGCEFVEKVEAGSLRLGPFSTNKGMAERGTKNLKKVAAKKHANTLLLGEKEINAWNGTFEADAYWCDSVPATAQDDK